MKSIARTLALFLSFLFLGCEDNPTPAAPDLTADSITFSVETSTEFSGLVTIKGTIKNIGGNYISNESQQSILLYERGLGTSGGNEVAKKAFTNLNAGDTLEITFTRNWDSSSPAEGEFPPHYILMISYDPDIYLDGNTANDDSNNTNNTLEVSGSPVNSMF